MYARFLVLKLIKQRRMDLVVLGTHGRTCFASTLVVA